MAPFYSDAMSESETPDSQTENGTPVIVTREKTVQQTETVTVKSKRGSGTNDRDTITKEVERVAELDIQDETNLPDLIGVNETQRVVSDVSQAMSDIRSENNDE
jgi:hypothetical protein